MTYDQLIFERSKPGRLAYKLPDLDVPEKDLADLIPGAFLDEKPLDFPEVTELDVIRHYTQLSMKNYSVDNGFYPLGSCTMKYNPKLNEDLAKMPAFACAHPLQPVETVQGTLEMLYDLGIKLCEISGMDAVTLQPAAGAHGEYAGIAMIRAYHEARGDGARTKILAPDSAHGTNPATAAMCGYDIVEVPSNDLGLVDVEALKTLVGPDTAGLMLTNPNTLGLFEKDIKVIADIVHEAGGLLYYDGANMNAILGYVRPGDMGFDVMHYNVHKTFSTPHGGGGPGAGPVCCKAILEPYLPVPTVVKKDDTYVLDYDRPESIGKLKSFVGQFGVLLKTYAYLLTMGSDGLKRVSEVAVLNANYLAQKLKADYNLPNDRICMHEFVLAGIKDGKALGVRTLDVAKRILDKGFHAPTVYFPLIIEEAMMIEPTETETKETLDAFIQALEEIAQEAREDASILTSAPTNTPIRRPDETKAARDLVLTHDMR